MPISLTKLRTDLYNIVDQVIETGLPVDIERNGKIVRIIAIEPKSKLSHLKPHPEAIAGDPETFVHMDWSEDWESKNK